MSAHIFSQHLEIKLWNSWSKIFDLQMAVVCLVTFVFVLGAGLLTQLNNEYNKNILLQIKIHNLNAELHNYKCQDFDFYKSKSEDYYKEFCVDYYDSGKVTVFNFGGLK